MKRIAVTGGAGNIAYALLFRIASQTEEPIALHILEISDAVGALEGVVMELQDCAFPHLAEIRIGSDPVELFGDVDMAILVGAQPRTKGMERKDLLQKNAQIFVEQGKALNASASRDVKVLVVGNPCNTNAWIAMHNAPDIPRRNFHSMMRLDQNRAAAQLALKMGRPITSISDMTVWGNHSATQVPDFVHARCDGQPITCDRSWLTGEFLTTVQQRGAAIIGARGKSSAASAASAVVDAVHSLANPTLHFSGGVTSEGNTYGIDEDLIFGFPSSSQGDWNWQVIPDLAWDDFLEEKIRATEAELISEREQVKQYV